MLKNKIHRQIQVIFIAVFMTLILSVFSFSQENLDNDSASQRNPFVALVTSDGRLLTLQSSAPLVKQMTLQGITFDEGGASYCVINGNVVMVGDQVDEYKVIKIEKEKVVLSKEGETLEMELKKEEE